jgi:hypothetical protein
MIEKFSEDYFFIKDVLHYLRNGNNTQQSEYKEKLLNRYKEYIKGVIGRQIKIEFDLKDDAFNQFCFKLFDPEYLDKYRGDASFSTYIYKEILGSIRKVMPKSKKEYVSEQDDNDQVANYDGPWSEEARIDLDGGEGFATAARIQHGHLSKGRKILQEDLEKFMPRQESQEQLLGIKDLRAKIDQALAVSILRLTQTHPKNIRILVMRFCDYSWDEIADCLDIGIDAARKHFTRSDGILDRFSALLIKTLWDNYKIDFQTVSKNFDVLMAVE